MSSLCNQDLTSRALLTSSTCWRPDRQPLRRRRLQGRTGSRYGGACPRSRGCVSGTVCHLPPRPHMCRRRDPPGSLRCRYWIPCLRRPRLPCRGRWFSPAIFRVIVRQSPGSRMVLSHLATGDVDSKQEPSPRTTLESTLHLPLVLVVHAQVPEISVAPERHWPPSAGKVTSKWLRPRNSSAAHSRLQVAVRSSFGPFFLQKLSSEHDSPIRTVPPQTPRAGLQISYV